MGGFADIHCHILPGVDDGPETMDQSIPLVRGLMDAGFDCFVATPHQRPPRWDQQRAHLEQLSKELVASVKGPVTIQVSAENFFDDSTWRRFESGALLRYPGGKTALFEFSAENLPLAFRERFFDMRVRGLKPVLAHPERNYELMKTKGLVEGLANEGVVFLISLTSLGKRDGGGVKRAAASLIKRGLALAAASDAHTVKDLKYVEKGIKVLRKLVGEDGLEDVLQLTPRKLAGM